MWPFDAPATLYFRTQDEAYSYGEREPSAWNAVMGTLNPTPPTHPPSGSSGCVLATEPGVLLPAEMLLQQLEVSPPPPTHPAHTAS